MYTILKICLLNQYPFGPFHKMFFTQNIVRNFVFLELISVVFK